MKNERLSYELIQEKSRETGISFSSLLGGAALEETVRRISESEFGTWLWLKNKTVLGESQYQRKLILNLEYDYAMPESEKTQDALLTELAEELFQSAFAKREDYGAVFLVEHRLLKRYLQIQLAVWIDGMRAPVTIKIYPNSREGKIPKEEEFTYMMFPAVKVSYKRSPAEDLLLEKFAEIFTKLELLQDLGAYYDIYFLLGEEGIDGRRMKERLLWQCEKLGIPKEKKRIELIAGYQTYPYMKKRWESYLCSICRTEPSWEQAVERFLQFFEPLWQAVTEDGVFFEDWMPELNRFL